MIYRTYQCNACGDTFEVEHASGDEPDPPCPYCDKVLEWRPGMFAIGTVKGKAVDITQKIIEEDYGMSNFKDNSREGDVAAIMPSETTAQREVREKITHDIMELSKEAKAPAQNTAAFWAGSHAGPPAQVAQTMLANAKAGPGADINPMKLLHEAGKKGHLPTGYRIIARA